MTPFSQAAELWSASGSPWSFGQMVEAHAQAGCVIITPEVFLLARPIRADWPTADACDPLAWCAEPDCWHVALAAGRIAAIHALVPYPLPWASFCRRGRFRRVPWAAAARIMAGSRTAAVRRASLGRHGLAGHTAAQQSAAAADAYGQ